MSGGAPGAFDAVVQDALAGGLSVRFRAHGSSMYPAIRDGEMIGASPVLPGQVVRGDILLFRCRGRLLAHRVVEVVDREGVRTLRTRGDAKTACDAPVDAAAVIGKVTDVVRAGRSVRVDGRAARIRHRAREIAIAACGWILPRSAVGRHATIPAA